MGHRDSPKTNALQVEIPTETDPPKIPSKFLYAERSLRAHIVGAERLGRCAPRVGASVREEERTYEEDRRYALDEPNQIWSFASEFMSAKSEDTLFD
jgi:hypothetical protein